ncbi:MAG: 23S rRNA (uracil(1939)-C(5))-methyltransferase RlmD [Eubacterium sp.]|nr:23S rRNA (uracil(1939)-C(5))-methyltransferase RlmD [Eubacterium sp.]
MEKTYKKASKSMNKPEKHDNHKESSTERRQHTKTTRPEQQKKAEGPKVSKESGAGQANHSAKPSKVSRICKASNAAENAGKVCPWQKKCGGCTSINRDYQETLKDKETHLHKLLGNNLDWDRMVGMEYPYYYRNKVLRTFGMRRDGKKSVPCFGIYQEGTHKIVPIDSCKIEDKSAEAIFADIAELTRSFKIRFYNEDNGTGLLRHVLVRTGRKTGQVLVCLVLASPVFPGKNNFVKALRKLHPEITTIVMNINPDQTSVVLGEREEVLFGKGFIEDELMGFRFRISAKSFYQVNPVQTAKLYRQAIEYADLKEKETVIDAYCGIGTIGICASEKAGNVIGIERNHDAVRNAFSNARLNKIKNVRFIEADATEEMMKMAATGEKTDVIFLDPPRTGTTEAFIAAAAALKPSRIVYISCGPDTLARDLKVFRKFGYHAKKARGFDMFPFTESIECVALLVR